MTTSVLEAKQAILEVIYCYCRALDRMDRDLAATLFHDGGSVDYGAFFRGTADEFIEWVWSAHGGFDTHSHQVTNVLIEIAEDRASAVSESYVTAQLWSSGDAGGPGTLITSRGRYVDRWSCRGDRWAIDHRRYVDDITVATSEHVSPGTGRRDRRDPSYEVFTP